MSARVPAAGRAQGLEARSGIGRWPAFWIVTTTLGLFLVAAAAPSPLYAIYAARWHFSALALTEVFAVYAIALLLALLLTGSLSDSLGRRPVVLAAILVQLSSLLLFVFAGGMGWLFAARIVQGIATGVAITALSAALVDLQPANRSTLAALASSAVPIAGLATGATAAGALVQYAPDPLHLIYWLLIAGFAVAWLGIALVPEPAAGRGRLRLLPHVGVEPAVRPAFIATLPTLIAGWSVGGFYLSLGPRLGLQLARSQNRLLGALVIVLASGVGAIAIVAARSWPPHRMMLVGDVALVVGLALSVTAIGIAGPILFFVATGITGIGFGIAWLGVLRTLVALAGPTARGALLAAIYIVAYLAFALPAVIAGYAVTRVGLHDAALGYAAAVALLAISGLIGTLLVGRRSA